MTNKDQAFIAEFDRLSDQVHSIAIEKGWWNSQEADTLRAYLCQQPDTDLKDKLQDLVVKMENRNDGEALALIHSEVSEALEALRHGNPPDDKIPAFSGVEAELADVIIRIMDISKARGWCVANAIVAKIAFNETRSHKHGGKHF